MSAVAKFPQPVLRPMREADLNDVIKVEQVSYEIPWTLGIFRDCMRVGYQCYVFEDPSGLIGHGVTSIAVGECHLLNICVHPDWQRRGLGRQLVEFFLDMARAKGVNTALLEVRASNRVAYHLYVSLGFNEVAMRPQYYPCRHGREDAIVLAREL